MSDCQECDRLQRAWDRAERERDVLRAETAVLAAGWEVDRERAKVAQAEIATLRAERDEARRERDEEHARHGQRMLQWLEKWKRDTRTVADARDEAQARARTSEAERDGYRAALADMLAGTHRLWSSVVDFRIKRDIEALMSAARTALRSPTPALDGGTADGH